MLHLTINKDFGIFTFTTLGGGGGGGVPYNGATQNVDLGEFGIDAGFLQLDTSPISPSSAVGKFVWNTTDGTANLGLTGGNVNLQLGQEEVVYVKNDDSVTINNGQPVYINSGGTERPFVRLASNSSAATSNRTIGIATESITANGLGFVTIHGIVRGLNTSTFSLGDFLYVGSTAGTLTITKPTAPNYSVLIGVVIKVDSIDGHIYVNPNIISSLNEL